LIAVKVARLRGGKMITYLPSTEIIMMKKILVPTDGSDLSRKAIEGAVDLARRTGAQVVGMTVTDPYPYSPLSEYSAVESYGQHKMRMDREADERLKPLKEEAGKAGVPVQMEVRSSLSPFQAIIEAARDTGCDGIVMASHGRRGISGLLLGSETHKVLTHTDIPVLVYR
jgi:nucleotide-binding universal stress UspA family protein